MLGEAGEYTTRKYFNTAFTLIFVCLSSLVFADESLNRELQAREGDPLAGAPKLLVEMVARVRDGKPVLFRGGHSTPLHVAAKFGHEASAGSFFSARFVAADGTFKSFTTLYLLSRVVQTTKEETIREMNKRVVRRPRSGSS